MARVLLLPNELRDGLFCEARAAFPGECCGLIEGATRGERMEAMKFHPARNLATRADRFEVDPAEQFRLMRALRGTGRAMIGCYHSHPDGRAEPSPRDLDGAGEDGFIWLIAALAARDAAPHLAAFIFENGSFRPLAMTAP